MKPQSPSGAGNNESKVFVKNVQIPSVQAQESLNFAAYSADCHASYASLDTRPPSLLFFLPKLVYLQILLQLHFLAFPNLSRSTT